MKLSFNVDPDMKLLGNPTGRILFGIIIVDTDDSEDTLLKLFRANDEGELMDLVQDHLIKREDYGDDEEGQESYDEEIERFQDDYDVIILSKVLGMIEDGEQHRREIETAVENVVCASRGNDAEGSYAYGKRVADMIVNLIK